MRTLAIAVATMVLASSGAAQTVIPLGQFRSVELHAGGKVILRHGQIQRVTMLAGDLQCTRVRLAGGQRLVIENHGKCRTYHRLQIEVITPELSAVSVSNGGTVRSVGAFPVQAAIEADVEQGGTIDIRSIPADAVDASVYSGGGIFISPRSTLAATVESGGGITYWGNARVQQSVRDGGFVTRGTPADLDKPLSEMSHDPRHVVPPIPPVPPIAPIPLTRR